MCAEVLPPRPSARRTDGSVTMELMCGPASVILKLGYLKKTDLRYLPILTNKRELLKTAFLTAPFDSVGIGKKCSE